ncbi:MAG: hypothetical protein JRJ75_13735 [Deltaproteobacteria bacterium]|nr:hypothetical protein [Deltaproteobacteria bacterium]
MRFRAMFAYIFICLALAVLMASTSLWAQGGQGGMKEVQEALKRAEQMKKHITVPELDRNNQAASRAARIYYSKQYQEKIGREIQRLKKTMFGDTLRKQGKLLNTGQPGAQRNFLMADERIYVFISSSMPLETIRNYAADLDRLRDPNITMVMRGFVNGIKRIRPTLKFLEKVLVRDPDCDFTSTRCDAFRATVNIDPLLFRRYNVTAVPAIVYVRGLRLIDAGLSEGIRDNASVAEAYMVSGDVPLDYALDKIHSKSHSPELEAVVKELRAGFYSQKGENK